MPISTISMNEIFCNAYSVADRAAGRDCETEPSCDERDDMSANGRIDESFSSIIVSVLHIFAVTSTKYAYKMMRMHTCCIRAGFRSILTYINSTY
jgi:hypothetical protein